MLDSNMLYGVMFIISETAAAVFSKPNFGNTGHHHPQSSDVLPRSSQLYQNGRKQNSRKGPSQASRVGGGKAVMLILVKKCPGEKEV
jgi:hypothetical protein